MDQEEVVPNRTVSIPVNLQSLYANGIMVNLSAVDISLIITINGQPTHQLNMPFPVAKSLVANLNKAIGDYEKQTEVNIKDVQEISNLLKGLKK